MTQFAHTAASDEGGSPKMSTGAIEHVPVVDIESTSPCKPSMVQLVNVVVDDKGGNPFEVLKEHASVEAAHSAAQITDGMSAH